MSSSKSRMTTHDLIDALGEKLSKKTFKSVRDLDRIDTRLQKLVAIVRGKRNALQPMHRLPPEVLVSIFLKVQQHLPSFLPIPLHGSTFDSHHRDWLSLLHVCRQWRGTIASSPLMWSTIDNSLMPDKFLLRSGASLLTVFYGIRQPNFEASEMRQLTHHIYRTKELHLGLSKWNESAATIFQGLTSRAPNLESLTIDTHGTVSAGYHLLPLFDGYMPRLRKLCLEFFTSWPTTYFTGLTSVCLHHQATPHSCRLTTTEFLDFLDASPDLEELILVYAGPTRSLDEDIPRPDPWRKVRLDKLKELSWGKIEDILHVRRLLVHLSLPPKTHLYFWGSSNADGGDLANFIPSDLSRLPCMTNIQEWRLRCSYSTHPSLDHGSFLVAFVDEVLYTLNIAWESYVARVPTVFRTILSHVESFYVRDTINISSDLWKDIFRALPRLTYLMVEPPQKWTPAGGMLGALCPEEPSGGGFTNTFGLRTLLKAHATDILCPNLRTLVIEAHPGFEGFSTSVVAKARQKRGSPLHRLEVRHIRSPTPEPAPSKRPGSYMQPDEVLPSGITPVEQARLDMEDRFALEKTVDEVVYTYEEEPVGFEPEAWPTKGYVWTMMTLPN